MRRREYLGHLLAFAALAVVGLARGRAARARGADHGARVGDVASLVPVAGSYSLKTSFCPQTMALRLAPNGDVTATMPDGALATGTWSVQGIRGGRVFHFAVTQTSRDKQGKAVGQLHSHGTFRYDDQTRALAGNATHEHRDGRGALLVSRAGTLSASRT